MPLSCSFPAYSEQCHPLMCLPAGDSLTSLTVWVKENAAVWDSYWGPRSRVKAARMGVGGTTVGELTVSFWPADGVMRWQTALCMCKSTSSNCRAAYVTVAPPPLPPPCCSGGSWPTARSCQRTRG